ncbi:MAG: glyoxylate reductase [Candidatus Heimdallarchaeota archaeon]
MSKYQVFVSRKIPETALDRLQERFEVDVWPGEQPPPKTTLLEKVKAINGLLPLLTDSIDSEVLSVGKNLLVVCQMAVGYDNIDVAEATRRGIYVTNTPGVLTETTADYSFALLMATARRITEADKWVRAGHWKVPWGPMMFLGGDIHGKTLGVIGLGRIGTEVARRATGFGMKVIYYDQVRKSELEQTLGLQYTEFERLLQEADFVSLHVPLTKETHHLIGENEFNLMKKTAYLINTSRGPVIDEEALYRGLSEGIIAGAGLDVFVEEPISKDNPLLTLENVTFSPHIASASIETRTKMAEMAVINMIEFFEGHTPPNLVNPEVLKIKPLK